MSVLLEFAMFPTDKGESVSEYVSQIIKMIHDSGSDYQLTPMGTIIETDTLSQAMTLVESAYQVLDDAGCDRVYSSLKLDIRKGKNNRLKGKVESVRNRIGDVHC
ncbi:MAG: MTH1187 family thiamine-binding protein [Sedimenticola sp.]|uniref:MTH1187 family thiamine-binding protein n=1 Tax=Sedimenticola thiotaurini TaxID=1543721 RepID=A0A558CS16_9GAMM|nr:MTH1187 family thiamine-binding protein [Sedimenticola sp.]TVT51557.1 MAG: MTH1187 family thiamine-binding protein [Sedimenticola thiotaurini]MCW8920798.1 MTH1187 family thiamine-binding protein [Sedimenticola sp.]MCW8947807.1 MTH1187 family thiamine-binding protein [Sedimenticola sp.]MCW8976943.1 MTH1187 family thiamine-binding protein [Sedimenticola sp.]